RAIDSIALTPPPRTSHFEEDELDVTEEEAVEGAEGEKANPAQGEDTKDANNDGEAEAHEDATDEEHEVHEQEEEEEVVVKLEGKELVERVNRLTSVISDYVFSYCRRGLFERHKLIVATMLTLRIQYKEG